MFYNVCSLKRKRKRALIGIMKSFKREKIIKNTRHIEMENMQRVWILYVIVFLLNFLMDDGKETVSGRCRIQRVTN